MKKKTTFLMTLLAGSAVLFMSNAGGRTGQRADNTTSPTCASCHTGANTFTVRTVIEAFEQGTTTAVTSYIPGQVYTIRATVSKASGTGTPARYGFQMKSNKVTGGAAVNAWVTPGTATKITTGAGSIAGTTFVEHNGVNTTGVFTCNWTAPALGSGSVIFRAAGLGANGNGNDGGGDAGSSSVSLTLTEGVASGIDGAEDAKLSVSVFPNPTTSVLNLSLEGNFSTENLQAQVVDMVGKVHTVQNITSSMTSVDVNALAPGIYKVVLMGNAKVEKTVTFLKN